MTQTTAGAAERDSLGFAGAAIFNFVLMIFINAHDAWRPWLDGIVTESFQDVVWAVNLGFVLQIFGNLILSVSSPRPLRGLTELVCSVGALAGAVVFYRVFPLDLSRFGDSAQTLGHTLAFVGVAASAMAILVNFASLFRMPDLKNARRATRLPSPIFTPGPETFARGR